MLTAELGSNSPEDRSRRGEAAKRYRGEGLQGARRRKSAQASEAARDAGQGRFHHRQPSPRGRQRSSLCEHLGIDFLDLIQEGNLGCDPRRREVRLAQGPQVLHLCHMVDPAGDHSRHRRQVPHCPNPRSSPRHPCYGARRSGESEGRPAATPSRTRSPKRPGLPSTKWSLRSVSPTPFRAARW